MMYESVECMFNVLFSPYKSTLINSITANIHCFFVCACFFCPLGLSLNVFSSPRINEGEEIDFNLMDVWENKMGNYLFYLLMFETREIKQFLGPYNFMQKEQR